MRIADRWFERRVVSPDLTLLWEPHVHPILRCNIWHLRGRQRDLLIDTGLGVRSLRDEIADLIDKPLLALATHIHYDHVGSLHEFEHRLMHALEAPRMAPYDEFAPLDRATLTQAFSELPAADVDALFAEGGFDDLLIDALPEAGYDAGAYQVASAPVTQTLEEGDVIDLGNRHLEVLHLPGHSPGSIGLYDAAEQTLFSGDAIYDGPLLDNLPDSNIDDYLATMARLRALPVRAVHGGHEPSFDGARLHALIDAYVAARKP